MIAILNRINNRIQVSSINNQAHQQRSELILMEMGTQIYVLCFSLDIGLRYVIMIPAKSFKGR